MPPPPPQGLSSDALEKGRGVAPPPLGAQPLTASAGFKGHLQPTVTAPNRFDNLLQPPSGAASEVPSHLMHPWGCPLIFLCVFWVRTA